jgi:hypothetical protein
MKILTIIAAHTNSEIKKICLKYSLVKYSAVSSRIIISNSLDHHDYDWEKEIISSFPSVSFINIPNDFLIDSGKWLHILKNIDYSFYDFVILANDSIIVTRPLNTFIEFIESKTNQDVEMFGMLDSNQSGYHIQSHFRALRNSAVPKFLAYIEYHRKQIDIKIPFYWIIQLFEVKITPFFITKSLFSLHEDPSFSNGDNLLFMRNLYFWYLNKKQFPLVKIKYLTECDFQYGGNIPADFSPSTYCSIHVDLMHLNNDQAFQHFIHHGIKEGRMYKLGQNKKLHETLKIYLYECNLSFLVEQVEMPRT